MFFESNSSDAVELSVFTRAEKTGVSKNKLLMNINLKF